MVTGRTWRLEAACAGYDPDWWFPATGTCDEAVKARLICGGCPVAAQCLDFALAGNLDTGIWGGTLPYERRGLRRAAELTRSWVRRSVTSCGTAAAYRRHLRSGEKPCNACVDAERRRRQEYEAAGYVRPPRRDRPRRTP